MMVEYCNRCNQPLRQREYHEHDDECLQAAIARAAELARDLKTAEEAAREWQNAYAVDTVYANERYQECIARADALAGEVAALRAELDAAPIQFIDGRAYRLVSVAGITAGIWPPAPPQE